ncbi:hypothetical protein ACFLTA_02950 [Bacteroidota bacterium]
MKYSVYCILQPGELEVQTLILFCTLKKNLKGDYSITVCIPGGLMDHFQPETTYLLDLLGINSITFYNPTLENSADLKNGDYFSNKYHPLPLLPDSDYVVFIDSDMLLVRKLDFSEVLKKADFFAKPVCYMNENHWEDLYGLFEMKEPSLRVRGTVDRKIGPPYFNGGFFAIKNALAENLLNNWLVTFHRITESEIMQDNLINREQAALAISIIRMKCTFQLLNENYNFPARSKQLQASSNPYFVHYHDPESIYKNAQLAAFAKNIFKEYPKLHTMASRLGNWKILTEEIINPNLISRRMKYRLKGFLQARRPI